MKYSLKNCTMPLKVCISRCLTFLSKEQYLFWKNQYFCYTCSIIDIEHPLQTRNMFEIVSIVTECSCVSYSRILPCVATQSSCEKTTFLENRITSVWHVYSSRWSDQPSLHLDNSHLKTCFQYYPTKMYSFTHIKGMLHKIKQQILQWRVYSFKKVLHAYSIQYVQTMFDYLRILRSTFFKLQYFSRCKFFKLQYVSRGEQPTSKGVIPKIWFVVLDKYHIMHSEKWCAVVKDIFYVLTYTTCSSFKKTYCEKWRCMCRRVHFWHRSRLRHVQLQWDVLPLKKNALVEGNTHFKEMQHFFSKESFKVFEHVLT